MNITIVTFSCSVFIDDLHCLRHIGHVHLVIAVDISHIFIKRTWILTHDEVYNSINVSHSNMTIAINITHYLCWRARHLFTDTIAQGIV